jgi:hypothetical protein
MSSSSSPPSSSSSSSSSPSYHHLPSSSSFTSSSASIVCPCTFVRRGDVLPAGVKLCAECEAVRVLCDKYRRFQRTHGDLGVLGSGRGGYSGGSQGSIAPKGVAVCLGLMASYCSPDAAHNMFIDLGVGDGRMMVYGGAGKFKYLRGTEIGGDLSVTTERIKQCTRCVGSVGKDDIDIELYRHERSITRPVGLSQSCHVAVWHFHQGWARVHIERVRGWLVRFKVAVYVSVSPGYSGFSIDGFVHVCSVTVTQTGQGGQSRARVFVRTDLVARDA